jgi:hypothetical protein
LVTRLIFVYILLLSLISCNQEPVEIDPSENRTVDPVRLEACGNTSFSKDILERDNSLSLFKCAEWDKLFPAMYEAMGKVSVEQWNHLMMPLDRALLGKKEKRDRLFSSLRKLDQLDALDGLEHLFHGVFTSNVLNAFSEAFICAEDPSLEVCIGRNQVSKEKIKSMFKDLDIPESDFAKMGLILTNISEIVKNNEDTFLPDLRLILSSDLFKNIRINVLNSLLKEMSKIDELPSEIRGLLVEFLKRLDSNSNSPWILAWLKSEGMNAKKFDYLLNYATGENGNPNFIFDMKVTKIGMDNNLRCNETDGRYIELNLKNQLSSILKYAEGEDVDHFNSMALENLLNINTAAEFCPSFKSYSQDIQYVDGDEIKTKVGHKINLTEMLSVFVDLLEEPKYFEVFKYALDILDQNLATGNNLAYVIELLDEDSIGHVLQMNKEIIRLVPKFGTRLFDVLLDVRPKTYLATAEITETLIDKKFGLLKGLSEIWGFIKPDQRSALIEILDRHFATEVSFLPLLNFYIDFLADYASEHEGLVKEMAGDDASRELLFEALSSMSQIFASEEAIADMRKFFSKGHMIKLIKVLTSGTEIKESARSQLLLLAEYNIGARTLFYNVDFVPPGQTISLSQEVECLKEIVEKGLGLRDLISEIPEECSESVDNNIGLKIFSWLNIVSDDFYKRLGLPSDGNPLFDEDGLSSASMLNSLVANALVVDRLLEDPADDSIMGIEYLINVFDYHFFNIPYKRSGVIKTGMNHSLKLTLKVLNKFNKAHEHATSFRTNLIRTYVKDSNFERTRDVVDYTTTLLDDYQAWLPANIKGTQYVPLDKYKCENFNNHNVGGMSCPTKDQVSRFTKNIITKLVVPQQAGYPTALSQMVQTMFYKGGIKIPLVDRSGDSVQNLKKLSLNESVQMIYNLTDRSLSINEKRIEYINVDSGVKTIQSMTTMERVEAVMRSVRFDQNYLGAHYKNAVAFSSEYDSTVAAKKSLMKKCVSWVSFCGKRVTGTNKLMAKNALATFDGLKDVNIGNVGYFHNGDSFESVDFKYGDYMRALLSVFVSSSSKKSQTRSALSPVAGRDLGHHNGVILTNLAMLTGFSNIGRLLHDRVGRSREEFNTFINSKKFKMTDENLFRGFDLPGTQKTSSELLKKLLVLKTEDGKLLLDLAIDWVAGLNYEETRLLEDMTGNLLVLTSYLGNPDGVAMSSFDDRYKGSSLYAVFEVLEQVIDKFPELHKNFPTYVELKDLLRPASNIVNFFATKLVSEDEKLANAPYYKLLNELFLLTKRAVLDEDFLSHDTKGLDLILSMLSSKENFAGLAELTADFYAYFNRLHYKKIPYNDNEISDTFTMLSSNLKKLVGEGLVSFAAIREYLLVTTVEHTRGLIGFTSGSNPHFDEPARLIEYLCLKNPTTNEDYFDIFFSSVFEEKKNIVDMLKRIAPQISIKEEEF